MVSVPPRVLHEELHLLMVLAVLHLLMVLAVLHLLMVLAVPAVLLVLPKLQAPKLVQLLLLLRPMAMAGLKMPPTPVPGLLGVEGAAQMPTGRTEDMPYRRPRILHKRSLCNGHRTWPNLSSSVCPRKRGFPCSQHRKTRDRIRGTCTSRP